MLKIVGKWSLAGALAIGMFGAAGGIGYEPIHVEAAKNLPDNHTIEQLKVDYSNNGYDIHVGKRAGTLLIRVDQPKVERNIEWVNWAIKKPANVSFKLDKETDISKRPYIPPYSFGITPERYYFDKGYPDKWDKEAGTIKTGIMKFSDFSDPSYYAGLAIYSDKAFDDDGILNFNGNNYALREDGQVKAYFYPNQDVTLEAYERISKTGIFPLMNKVMWGKTELWPSQLGKVTIKKPVTLWKQTSNGKMEAVRELKLGDEYRVYRYLNEKTGYYGVGGGMYVEKNAASVLYETPSLRNLRLVRIMQGEE